MVTSSPVRRTSATPSEIRPSGPSVTSSRSACGDPERALRVDAHLAAGIVNILDGWGHLVRRELDRAGVLTQLAHATG